MTVKSGKIKFDVPMKDVLFDLQHDDAFLRQKHTPLTNETDYYTNIVNTPFIKEIKTIWDQTTSTIGKSFDQLLTRSKAFVSSQVYFTNVFLLSAENYYKRCKNSSLAFQFVGNLLRDNPGQIGGILNILYEISRSPNPDECTANLINLAEDHAVNGDCMEDCPNPYRTPFELYKRISTNKLCDVATLADTQDPLLMAAVQSMATATDSGKSMFAHYNSFVRVTDPKTAVMLSVMMMNANFHPLFERTNTFLNGLVSNEISHPQNHQHLCRGFRLSPPWLNDKALPDLEAKLKDMDVEPIEAIMALLKSNKADQPPDEPTFLGLIQNLRENNDIRKFGRYNIKILEAARKPIHAEQQTALILAAKADWNDAFYTYESQYETLIDKGYGIRLYEINSESDFDDRIKQVGSKNPIDLLFVDAHGTPSTVVFGENPIFNIITSNKDYSKLKQYFEQDKQVILNACKTGQDLAKKISTQLNADVFANTENGGLQSCEFDEKNRISSCHFRHENGKGIDSSVTYQSGLVRALP